METVTFIVVGAICFILGFTLSKHVYYKKGYKEGFSDGEHYEVGSICGTDYEKER